MRTSEARMSFGMFGVLLMGGVLAVYAPRLAMLGATALALMVAIPDQLPRILFFIILALVPMESVSLLEEAPADRTYSVFSSVPSVSIIKLLFPPALALLVWQHAVRRKPFAPNREWVMMAGLLAAIFLSYLVNPSHYRSLMMLRRYLSLALLFALAVNVLETKQDIAFMLIVIPVTCLFSAVSWLAAHAGLAGLLSISHAAVVFGAVRMTGLQSYAEAPSFARMLVIALFIVVRFALAFQRWKKFLLWMVAGLLIFAILRTLARGSLVALIAVFVYAFFRFRRQINMRRTVPVVLALFMAALLFVPPAFYKRSFILLRDQRVTDTAFMRRWGSNLIATRLFLQHPLFGIGPGAFYAHYYDAQNRFVRFASSGAPKVAPGIFQTMACEHGLLGLFFMSGLIILVFKDLRWIYRSYKSGPPSFILTAAEAVELALLSALVTGLFENNHMHKYFWILIAAVPALVNLRKEQIDAASDSSFASHPSS